MKAKYRHNGSEITVTFDCPVSELNTRSRYSVSVLEMAIKAVLAKGGISANVYNNRPKAVAPTVNDFAVAHIEGTVYDLSAYASCRLFVSLLAKDASGFKNGKKLSLMQDKTLDYLPLCLSVYTDDDVLFSEYEIDDTPDILGDRPDDYGFHARMIVFNLTIKNL